ncbi:MAG: hypothetical protein ABIX28_19360 [Vicinamibacterales bacterium]
MASEDAVVANRPSPWLLIALGLAVVGLVASYMWPSASATPVAPASTQARAVTRRGDASVEPADLDVKLEALLAARPGTGRVERNPFRFQPKPPPPPPPAPPAPKTTSVPPVNSGPPPPPPGPPPPPPIPLKFIGIVEKQGLKVAAMSDCRITYYGTEGEVIDGRYRLVRIGVESLVIEYVDGRGRTAVRLEGCPPRQ